MNVLAYIDPSSGSLVFQAVVGSAMAAALGTKVLWRRVSGLFRSGDQPFEEQSLDSHERPSDLP